jgi:hypothetical protein
VMIIMQQQKKNNYVLSSYVSRHYGDALYVYWLTCHLYNVNKNAVATSSIIFVYFVIHSK